MPDSARTRVIVSAQIVVEPEDVEGLGRNELVLILGSMPQDGAELDRLVTKIFEVEASAAALPETYRGPFRRALIDELAGRRIPVLEVPQSTRFADLIDTVNRFQASPDSVRFNRMLTMQQSLVAALGPNQPVTALLSRLAKVCGGGAGMLRASGEVEASEGVLPFRLLLEEIADSRFPEIEVNVSGWNALAIRFAESTNRPVRWLLVGSRREQFVSSYVRAAARVTASLIDATDRIDVLVANQDQAVRSSVLSQLLDLNPYDNPDVLAGRAASLGVTFAREVRVLDIVRFGPRTVSGTLATPLEERISRAFIKFGATVLVSRRSSSTAVLVEAEPRVRDQALSYLAAEDSGLVMGLGRAITHVRDVSTSHYDAVLALQQARLQAGTRVFSYDDFKFTTRLLAHVGLERMAEWSTDIMGPLKDKPILVEALDAFFEAELDVMAAAKALHIHHNSLRYRLQKIEEIVGGTLRSPDVIAAVQLARLAEQASTAAGRSVRRPAQRQAGVARGAAAVESPLDRSETEAPTGLGAVPID
ncbi:helix-turn-helix domain-containing protein [Arthrobacter sp. M4]|uniref:helix-turn-helix domain-containing protein n=1 Tax=Arthrobacter sp. M4 TaxID=218160 RepID=UPI001CDB7816|nr:helix-turn-helix domain-containing protein [Arthrobacter sp. M4]MCA4134819.1 helix-turn-helix domain-containing protein [Arthrobacter sp. M4]